MNLEVVGVSEQGARSEKILVLSQMRKGIFRIPVSYPCKRYWLKVLVKISTKASDKEV